MSKELISVVVPCYNEQEVLPLFYDEIIRVSDGMSEKYADLEFEFLFINDGSKDKTLDILREFALKDERVRYVSFSRNFGKEAGIFAGIENSRGDYVVIIDADLQHPPARIPEMYEYVKSGEFDCASTRRISREGDSKVLSFFARSFYKLINLISQTYIIDGAQDFRFMTRQMVDSILKMSEYHRFSKGIFSWVGFRTKYIDVTNTERAAGKTTFNFWRLFKYSLEGIIAFSVAPLALSVIFGVLFCVASLAALILSAVNGSQTALIAGIVMLVGGIQLFCTGINGQYLSKTYMETKARPKYIASETEDMYKKRLK